MGLPSLPPLHNSKAGTVPGGWEVGRCACAIFIFFPRQPADARVPGVCGEFHVNTLG